MKIVLDEGAKMPTRAHPFDAGLDLYARESRYIMPGDSQCFDTGVHIQIPEGCVGLIKSKSGLNVRNGLLSEGVIDCGYTGSIVVKLYNFGHEVVDIQAGQKISQLVIVPCVLLPLEEVEKLDRTSRGAGGFGSTGK